MRQEHDTRMWAVAYDLARSGYYPTWWFIELELQSLGFPRAGQLLRDDQARKKLNRMCAKARKGVH